MKNKFIYFFITLFLWFPIITLATSNPGMVVIQTDFGIKDGAVSAVKGVMYSVDPALKISDLTNEITPFNIWEASYRLYQVAQYWPQGTVFVSVVDPGVGTHRKSIVAESNNGYYFVTPDNGTLTLINDQYGLKEVREIDETKNRLKGSNDSYTFHGRDVYGYVAARLASGKIQFEDVGPKLETPIVKLSYQKPFIKDHKLEGTITILDPQYGNLWTNIDDKLVHEFDIQKDKLYKVTVYYKGQKKFQGSMPFEHTFGEVKKDKNLLYVNSLMNLSVATNQKNFAKLYHVDAGADWRIEVEQVKS